MVTCKNKISSSFCYTFPSLFVFPTAPCLEHRLTVLTINPKYFNNSTESQINISDVIQSFVGGFNQETHVIQTGGWQLNQGVNT